MDRSFIVPFIIFQRMFTLYEKYPPAIRQYQFALVVSIRIRNSFTSIVRRFIEEKKKSFLSNDWWNGSTLCYLHFVTQTLDWIVVYWKQNWKDISSIQFFFFKTALIGRIPMEKKNHLIKQSRANGMHKYKWWSVLPLRDLLVFIESQYGNNGHEISNCATCNFTFFPAISKFSHLSSTFLIWKRLCEFMIWPKVLIQFRSLCMQSNLRPSCLLNLCDSLLLQARKVNCFYSERIKFKEKITKRKSAKTIKIHWFNTIYSVVFACES